MATYGEGDPTDNAQEFYQWLQSGDVDLTGLKYAVRIILLLIFKYTVTHAHTTTIKITE